MSCLQHKVGRGVCWAVSPAQTIVALMHAHRNFISYSDILDELYQAVEDDHEVFIQSSGILRTVWAPSMNEN